MVRNATIAIEAYEHRVRASGPWAARNYAEIVGYRI
jgi:hypothetical protein